MLVLGCYSVLGTVEAKAHGLPDLWSGTVVNVALLGGGMASKHTSGGQFGARFGVTRYVGPDRSDGTPLWVDVGIFGHGTRLELEERRPEGGLAFRLGWGVAFLELSAAVVGRHPDTGRVGFVGRALVGAGLPNVLSVSAGLVSFERRPAFQALFAVGWAHQVHD